MDSKSLKQNKFAVIAITAITLILIVGVGYAFFSASVSNTNNEKLVTQTATLSLKFDDGDNGISGTLNLGESITKKFTIENTGTLDAYAKINWYNLVNTYMNGSLTYNLEQSTNENGTYTSIDGNNVPVSSTETTETLKNGILVPVNTTYYYKLTITFNNLENVNQNSDINASFYSYFSLEEGKLLGADKLQNLVAGANTSSTDVITKEEPAGSTCTNTLAYDGTSDNNLRYVGANPCNYVTFNGESPTIKTVYKIVNKQTGLNNWVETFNDAESCNSTYANSYDYWDNDNEYECQQRTEIIGGWRIIGVMNNVDDGTGKKETRIKLVRNEPLGNYSWDTSDSSVISGTGVDDWSQADLMQELNGDYLNTSLSANTMWYNGRNNQKTAEYDYTKGLKAETQSLIGDAKWYSKILAYNTDYQNDSASTANFLYYLERQEYEDYDEPKQWIGKVALIYPSDYGFAVGGNNRSNCLNSNMYSAYGERSQCGLDTWLVSTIDNGWAWTIISLTNGYIADIHLSGYDGDHSSLPSSYEDYVYPSLYLKSNIAISNGNGSPENPYILE